MDQPKCVFTKKKIEEEVKSLVDTVNDVVKTVIQKMEGSKKVVDDYLFDDLESDLVSYQELEVETSQTYYNLVKCENIPLLPEFTKNIEVYAIVISKNSGWKNGKEFNSLIGVCKHIDPNDEEKFVWKAYRIQGITKNKIFSSLFKGNLDKNLKHLKYCNRFEDPEDGSEFYYLINNPILILDTHEASEYFKHIFIKSSIVTPSEEMIKSRDEELEMAIKLSQFSSF